MNSFAMCITLTYSLAEYSLEVKLQTFKQSIVDVAVLGLWQFLGYMKYLFFVLKIKILYSFFGKKTFRDFSLK